MWHFGLTRCTFSAYHDPPDNVCFSGVNSVYLPRYGSILIDVGIIAFSISTRRTCKSRFLFVFHTGSTSDLSPLIISVRVMGSNKNHNLFRAGVGAPRLNNYHLDARRFGIIGPMTAVNFTTSRLNPDKMSTKAPDTLPKSSTVRRFLPTRTSSIPSTFSTIFCQLYEQTETTTNSQLFQPGPISLDFFDNCLLFNR